MRQFNRSAIAAGLAASLALVLAACGGNDSLPPKATISKVYVMGDSLADAGTFGIKFTVQDASTHQGFPIWPQIVAGHYGLAPLAQCNFYSLNFDGSLRSAPNPACTNFAIGGARVYAKASDGGPTSPLNVGVQMATKASLGNYTANDLVLIDGGGNDAADLVGAYLGAASGAAGQTAYRNFLLQQLDTTTADALLATPNTGPAQAAGAYMQKLADTFYDQIRTQVIEKGASHVAVLNMPDITLTPRFKALLQGVAQQSSPAQSQALQGVIRQWIGAFNAKLQTNIGNNSRIALVDFYTDFTDEINNPASYSLTNATDASCPVTGVGSDGLPSYTFPTCTSAALDALPGKTPGWWKTYAFSDGFHPTPLGHSLLAASVSRALARAGWL